MHIFPQQSTQNNKQHLISQQTHQLITRKDGQTSQRSPLLAVPPESLTHITAFLDVPSLLALSLTNRQLHEHIANDNTWHKAFLCQCLAVGPECEALGDRALLLRRTETSWKKEFVHRANLLRRWELSRNSTIVHTPHHSPISSMHLMSDRINVPPLLTASLQYGVVARSLPLTGTVFKGFLEASGTVNGLGIGNPNVEFTPNISACALASEGGTAYIVWGYSHGEVAVTKASRAMDARPSAKLSRCRVSEQHDAAVTNVVWSEGQNSFVTAATDGVLKLWVLNRMRCAWSSPKTDSHLPDPCVKIATFMKRGIVVCALKSGMIVVWSGLDGMLSEDTHIPSTNASPVVTRILPPFSLDKEGTQSSKSLQHLIIDFRSPPSCVSILLHYTGDSNIHRLDVDTFSQTWDWVQYCGGTLGPICSLLLSSTELQTGISAVLVGDKLGRVTVYNWAAQASHSTPGTYTIPPSQNFDAHEDGAITALAFNHILLVTGSSRGTVKVWDALTFVLLRSFPSPSPRPTAGMTWHSVEHILAEKSLLVVGVGSRVMAWKAGPIRNEKSIKSKQTHKGKRGALAKWHQQLEFNRDIAESRLDLEEELTTDRQTHHRHHEQLHALERLGLNEAEALEYVLMVSRDEEAAKQNIAKASDDGVFEDDTKDALSAHSRCTSPSSSWTNEHHVERSNPTLSHQSSLMGHNVSVLESLLPEMQELPTVIGTSATPENLVAQSSSLPRETDELLMTFGISQCNSFQITASQNCTLEPSNPHRAQHIKSAVSSLSSGVTLTLPPRDVGHDDGAKLRSKEADMELKFALDLSLAESLSLAGLR